jgi:hypothetical protein
VLAGFAARGVAPRLASLDDVIEADSWARAHAREWLGIREEGTA